jgi:hypothetical protein
VIGGMHHQHDGSSRQLAWDPGIVVADRSATDTNGIASLRSPKFTLGVRRISSLEEQSFEELTEPRQFMIVWPVKDSLASSFVCTGKISTMSRGCFCIIQGSLGPCDFTTYEQVQDIFAWRELHRRFVRTYGEVYDLAVE